MNKDLKKTTPTYFVSLHIDSWSAAENHISNVNIWVSNRYVNNDDFGVD